MKSLQDIHDVRDVLVQELDCFKFILAETQKVIKVKDTFTDNDYSLERIGKLLESRERWIELLQRLEEHKSQYVFTEKDHYDIRNEISKIAHTLVEIDAKLLDYIQMKKINKVKDIIKIADHKNSRINHKLNDLEKSKIIDIRQE